MDSDDAAAGTAGTAVDRFDDLAVALRWTSAVMDDPLAAEDCAIEAVCRFRRREEPAWLRMRDAWVRLRYLTVQTLVAVRPAA